jgi:hypothetical protein
MAIEVDETFLMEMHSQLQTCANSNRLNGPASYMLAQELADLGKPMKAVTLGELHEALDRVDARYNRMCDRLNEGKDGCGVITCRVEKRGVQVNGRFYKSPELAELVGEVVTVDLWAEDSLSAIATHNGYSFQVHAQEGALLQART